MKLPINIDKWIKWNYLKRKKFQNFLCFLFNSLTRTLSFDSAVCSKQKKPTSSWITKKSLISSSWPWVRFVVSSGRTSAEYKKRWEKKNVFRNQREKARVRDVRTEEGERRRLKKKELARVLRKEVPGSSDWVRHLYPFVFFPDSYEFFFLSLPDHARVSFSSSRGLGAYAYARRWKGEKGVRRTRASDFACGEKARRSYTRWKVDWRGVDLCQPRGGRNPAYACEWVRNTRRGQKQGLDDRALPRIVLPDYRS